MSLTYTIKAILPVDADIQEAVRSFNYLYSSNIDIPKDLKDKLQKLGFTLDEKIAISGEYVSMDIDDIYEYEGLGVPVKDYEDIACVVDMQNIPKTAKYIVAFCS